MYVLWAIQGVGLGWGVAFSKYEGLGRVRTRRMVVAEGFSRRGGVPTSDPSVGMTAFAASLGERCGTSGCATSTCYQSHVTGKGLSTTGFATNDRALVYLEI